MKKYLIIIGLLILVVGALFYFWPKTKEKVADNKVSVDTSEKIVPIEFSDEQLKGYYAVYENPYVLHIRKAFDSYLAGKNIGIDEATIESGKFDDGTLRGLDAFDKGYYKSKFIVFAINDNNVGGGKIVNIIAKDLPDKLFNVWIYPVGDSEENLEMRGFYQNQNFDQKEMDKINIQYKTYFNDEQHML